MKATIKIFTLLLAIASAIGGVLIYAKTIVEPPVALKEVDQYKIDLLKNYDNLSKVKSELEIDSIYTILLDRIDIYKTENKITRPQADENLNEFMGVYIPLFTKYSLSKFQKPVWYDNDHNNMLSRIKDLKEITDSDKTPVLNKIDMKSLNLINKIIADFRQARKIGRSTTFTGITNAQSIINQARQYANDEYLSNSKELSNSLNSVRSKIAESHYDYITREVNKLGTYEYLSRKYYEETLIPIVDKVVTEYDNNANTLYGSKKDVNPLWIRARSFYDSALNYYTRNEY